MVTTIRTFGSFSVNDIDAARRFYGDTLGVAVSPVGEHGPLFVHGPDGHTLIYAKPATSRPRSPS